jgi:hypothetical protein
VFFEASTEAVLASRSLWQKVSLLYRKNKSISYVFSSVLFELVYRCRQTGKGQPLELFETICQCSFG